MIEYLPILAIETSGELCSAAVLENVNSYASNSIRSKYVHSEKLIQIIDHALSELDMSIDDIKLLAISNGPGSFTGLRIGMSTAKGIAFGKQLPIIPVPTFESFAYQIAVMLQPEQKFVIVNNVNVNELYFASFISKKEGYEVIQDVILVQKSDLSNLCSDDYLVFGNYFHPELQIKHTFPDALFVARWAYFFGKDLVTSSYDFLEPNYLKNFIVKGKK
jgi:tRNA threonylcarbamoyladenosine biosynthesis protein TsaB